MSIVTMPETKRLTDAAVRDAAAPPRLGSLRSFLTARDTGERLSEQRPVPWCADESETEKNLVNLYDDVRYQEIVGFGGALTEAAAVTFHKLAAPLQQRVLAACFDPRHGNRYTLCRTHMNSCDFAEGNYACCDRAGDTALASFSIARDKQALLPLIQEAQEVAGHLKLIVSPWSPPAWMKTNGQMNQGGKLRAEYREAWALHYARFIQAYEAEGVPVWGLTVQNEPKATQRWDSCVYTADEERDFVKNHLGPLLRREGLGDRKLMIWDHNKERLYERARCVFEDPEASSYVWGAAFHWYTGDHFEALDAVHHRWPDKGLAFTEGCLEQSPDTSPWAGAERYAHDILGNLNHGMTLWCDWNILLDEQGGPNHVENFCSAPIIGHTQEQRLEFAPSYHAIGHFSRFIEPGSRRIAVSRYTDRLECTAVRTPAGRLVTVVLNRTDADIPFVLRCHARIASLNSPPHSILTLLSDAEPNRTGSAHEGA